MQFDLRQWPIIDRPAEDQKHSIGQCPCDASSGMSSAAELQWLTYVAVQNGQLLIWTALRLR